ncbi:sulfite exporter TauE/SafE family protein [Conexibacter sp. SYSU D00693]|uniref:sulfite exporter TauE/SafE family protein n=1 Tax=Conexibacter sp. SYSU D00693 TaxID=2812560 RepID=UPI00196B7D7C|nr:sulfite exporter TauE/SafE family protein [Conexibacter sp. SYSU D00693]
MTVLEALAVLAAGLAAGTINTVVGSGTLVTFPVLLAVGYPPVTANVSNGIGLVPGSVSGAWGYRAELRGQGRRAVRLGAMSVTGGVLGAVALLTLPDDAFGAIVPVFIAIALVAVVLQPRISAAVAARRPADRRDPDGGPAVRAGVLLGGVYGGYFGAAQGILLLAVLGPALPDDLQRVNALKNVLAGLVNGVSGLIFCFAADVAWDAALLIAMGSAAGGQLGARYGRRLSPGALRGLIVAVGVAAIAQLVL